MVDLSIDTDSVVKTKDLENVMQQIEMLFDTSPFEVIGEPMFGSDFERFLWDLTVSNYDIARYIETTIRANVDLLDYDVSVDVSLMNGTENDIILADITIGNNGENYTKTYRINQ